MKIVKSIIKTLTLSILFLLIGLFINIQIINAYYPLCDKLGYYHIIPKTFYFISLILDYIIFPMALIGAILVEVKNSSTKLIKKISAILIIIILILVFGHIIDTLLAYISVFMAKTFGDGNFITNILSIITKYSYIIYNLIAMISTIIVAKL